VWDLDKGIYCLGCKFDVDIASITLSKNGSFIALELNLGGQYAVWWRMDAS
jgi:hypothetical protein